MLISDFDKYEAEVMAMLHDEQSHRPVTVMTRREFLCEDNRELATEIVNKKLTVVMASFVCDCVDFCDAVVLWVHLLVFCSCSVRVPAYGPS